ncbi:hypothetical protein [Sinorhizobium meliloti]|uniref:hypothetical protein n=1 Tax=Rhizobium meliloti TaxID=382 RepID=UPI00115FC45C|nr:hypothetical protein [Sinorhizobium meliloti]MDE4586658.1 hypothetical protein [Sinorhizobium meliloti]
MVVPLCEGRRQVSANSQEVFQESRQPAWIELKKAFAAVSIVMRQNRVDRGMQFCREPDKGDNIGLSSLSGVRLAIGVPIYDLR